MAPSDKAGPSPAVVGDWLGGGVAPAEAMRHLCVSPPAPPHPVSHGPSAPCWGNESERSNEGRRAGLVCPR